MKLDIPDYEIEAKLGTGGMASVYRARHLRLHRLVALKVMHPELTLRDSDFSERFLREARIAADLSHPNLVQVYDVNLHGKTHFIAMEYVSGGDLKERLAKPIDRDELLAIVDHIIRGLDYAHSRGYIHRDIKPANILFRDSGEAVVSDFGIARAIDSNTQLTKTGSVIGTPTYMSPEQASGVTIDGRSDLYSVAVIVYEILTGTVPYVGETSLSIAIKHISEPIPTLPKALQAVQPFFNRGMAKDPQDRFSTGQELLDMLQDALDLLTHEDITATKTLLLVRPGEKKQRAGQTTALRRSTTPITAASGRQGTLQQLTPHWPVIAGALALLVVLIIAASWWQADTISKNQQAQVQQLLSAAQADITAGRLYQPANNNALRKYQTALAIADDYPPTLDAVATLNNLLMQQSDLALQAGNWSDAELYANQVLLLSPDHDSARQQLDKLRERREQQQAKLQQQLISARQAALAEQWPLAIELYSQLQSEFGEMTEFTQELSTLTATLLQQSNSATDKQAFQQANELLAFAKTTASLSNDPALRSAVKSAQTNNNRQQNLLNRQQKIQTLLGQARATKSAEQASKLYQQVLKLDPQNSAAQSGITRTTDSLLTQTEQAIINGNLTTAANTLNRIDSAMRLTDGQRRRASDLRSQLKVYRAQQADLDKLFDRFERYMQAPKVTSAEKIYRRIELINYQHPRLPALRRELADGYLVMAQREAQAEDWDDTIRWCNKGLAFVADQPQLKALLATAIEKEKTTDKKLLDFFR